MRSRVARNRRDWAPSGRRGMSLIELLVAVAIAAIVLIALLTLYVEGQKYFFNKNSQADTIEEIRSDMARISRDIRDAVNVADGPVAAYDGQQYSTRGDCLVLEVPSIDGTGGTIAGSVDHIIYSYEAGENRLVKIVSPLAGVRQNQRTVLATSLVSPASGATPFNLKFFNWNGLTEVTSSYADAANGAFIIEVELTARGPAVHRGGKPYVETFRTQAKMRNKVVPT